MTRRGCGRLVITFVIKFHTPISHLSVVYFLVYSMIETSENAKIYAATVTFRDQVSKTYWH